jgi:hypothetical protein
MNSKVLELAIQALESQKAKIDQEIAELQSELKGTRSPAAQSGMTQSERMKAYWAAKRAAKSGSARISSHKNVQRRRTAAEKKAMSEKMRAVWAKRRAAKK